MKGKFCTIKTTYSFTVMLLTHLLSTFIAIYRYPTKKSVSDKKLVFGKRNQFPKKEICIRQKRLYPPKQIGIRQKKSVTAKKKSVSAKKKSVSDKKSKCQSISLYPPQVGLCLSPNLGANCKPAKELSPSPLRLFLTLLD